MTFLFLKVRVRAIFKTRNHFNLFTSKIVCCFHNTPEFIFTVDILNNTNGEKREGEEKEGSEFRSQIDSGLNLSLPFIGQVIFGKFVIFQLRTTPSPC